MNHEKYEGERTQGSRSCFTRRVKFNKQTKNLWQRVGTIFVKKKATPFISENRKQRNY
jgi:hypothetical protein